MRPGCSKPLNPSRAVTANVSLGSLCQWPVLWRAVGSRTCCTEQGPWSCSERRGQDVRAHGSCLERSRSGFVAGFFLISHQREPRVADSGNLLLGFVYSEYQSCLPLKPREGPCPALRELLAVTSVLWLCGRLGLLPGFSTGDVGVSSQPRLPE